MKSKKINTAKSMTKIIYIIESAIKKMGFETVFESCK